MAELTVQLVNINVERRLWRCDVIFWPFYCGERSWLLLVSDWCWQYRRWHRPQFSKAVESPFKCFIKFQPDDEPLVSKNVAVKLLQIRIKDSCLLIIFLITWTWDKV